jgi:hypothetical protein
MGSATKVKRSVAKRARRIVVLPGDTVGTSVRRVVAFVIGWGAFLTLILWSGYHRGWFHGPGDGVVVGVVFTIIAVVLGRNAILPPGPNGRQGPYLN